jgi:hypothetical protein
MEMKSFPALTPSVPFRESKQALALPQHRQSRKDSRSQVGQDLAKATMQTESKWAVKFC